MVTVTDQAATAIRLLTASPDVPSNAGLRITGDLSRGGNLELAVESAEADDTIVESDGALLFLDQTAAAILDHKALDAQSDEDGNLRFIVANEPPPAGSNGAAPS